MIYIIGYRDTLPDDIPVIETTSRSETWSRGLSPFLIGPCLITPRLWSSNMENAWQYSKVYPGHLGKDGKPTLEWYRWAREGFERHGADRYPMGKGVKPICSYWQGKTIGYIEARKQIYIPLYSNTVKGTHAYKLLEQEYKNNRDIALKDFDGYRYDLKNMSLGDVIEYKYKRMGHAFVLAMMLEGLI